MKDCFGLHGHYAFGSVAEEKIGVGRKSDTCVGLTTDSFHSLQAGKTVDILRCAAESTDLLPPSALPRSLRSLRLCPPARPAAVDYRLPPVIILPLWMIVMLLVFVVIRDETNRSASACVVILVFGLLLYMVN